jgi:branched-chain amino acid transport system substrate-binding protein
MLKSWTHCVCGWTAGAALTVVAGVVLTGAASAQSKEPIKIGFGMSLTGPLAANGQQALLGQKIWEEEVNAKGGLLGRPVKLIYYDDQSNPSTVPGIYTKLLDVDKVDLVVGGYATNQNAPAMPVVIQKGKVYISLFALAVNSEFHYPKYFSMLPIGQHPKTTFTEGVFQVAEQQNPKPTTVALAAADAEFSKNACEGARDNVKTFKMKLVYDRTYPPSTTDFSPVVRAIQASKADIVIVCSYPLDSVGMILAANEVGLKPKIFGGAMVGLQATVFKNKLGPALNGIINYETWVPSDKLMLPETKEFFKKYQARAPAEKIDPLGYYLGGWGYAYMQVLADAVTGANSINDDKIAEYLRSHAFNTVMGSVKFGKDGEWAESRWLQVQYHDIKPGAGLDTWRGMSYQTVLTPKQYATGKAIYPYEKAR